MTTQNNSWYKTGTVDVTNGNNGVVGTGTLFLSQVHPGDIFTIDKVRIYEVESVTDDTHLTLTEAYQGSTQTGSVYYVLRFWNSGWSMNASLAQQVATLIEGFQNAIEDQIVDNVYSKAPSQNAVYDALSTKANKSSPALTGTPTAPTAPVGTNTTQIATTNFVNSSVTEFYPIPMTPTYVDGTHFTVDGYQSEIFFHGRVVRLIGTTSGEKYFICDFGSYDSGTDKTTVTLLGNTLDSDITTVYYAVDWKISGVFEQDGNANGLYTKFSNGLLICQNKISVTNPTGTNTNESDWTMPVNAMENTGVVSAVWSDLFPGTTTIVQYAFQVGTNIVRIRYGTLAGDNWATSYSRSIDALFIGRWY